jgi:YD repeat-containing protein
VTKSLDARGYATTFSYDTLNRLTAVTEPVEKLGAHRLVPAGKRKPIA